LRREGTQVGAIAHALVADFHAGVVVEIAYFGDRTRYVVQTDGQRVVVSRANVGTPLTLAVGDPVWTSHAADAGALVTA